MSEKNDMVLKNMLSDVIESYVTTLDNQLSDSKIKLNDYARQCAVSTVIAINRLLKDSGIVWADVDRSNVMDILTTVSSLELNPNATPKEVYFTIRNKRVVKVDKDSKARKEVWQKTVEMGIEGDGNDAILVRFGRGVKTVHRFWAVRENDDFSYPEMVGLEVTPPSWKPKSNSGKYARVVYPITFEDGRTEYYICEREEVFNNLLAHISNNMMNETFGICPDRYKATETQKKQITQKKKEMMGIAKEKGFEVLDLPEFEPYISSAWRSDYSREAMILRKMRNNIVKKIPKDFSIPQGAIAFTQSEGENYKSDDVIEVDFSEDGTTSSKAEQAKVDELNKELMGE